MTAVDTMPDYQYQERLSTSSPREGNEAEKLRAENHGKTPIYLHHTSQTFQPVDPLDCLRRRYSIARDILVRPKYGSPEVTKVTGLLISGWLRILSLRFSCR